MTVIGRVFRVKNFPVRDTEKEAGRHAPGDRATRLMPDQGNKSLRKMMVSDSTNEGRWDEWFDNQSKTASHSGDEPYCKFRKIHRTSHESTANEYLANHWTLLSVLVVGFGDPKERREHPEYVLGWKHPSEPWHPQQTKSLMESN